RLHSDSAVSSSLPAFSETTIAPLLALDRATEAVAERITPAVVNIRVVGKAESTQAAGPMDPSQIPAPFRQFFQGGPFQAQPQPRVFEAIGTGLIISPDGYIVTNNHVVNGATSVSVTLNDKRSFDAKVIGTDKATDLAVVKINASGLASAAFGDSSQLKPGQSVLAIGDPLGMDFSVTRGIISALDRNRDTSENPDARGSFIQTDAPINHGNSGGPLVDARGEVIGINTEMLSTSGASIGIGFAIPSNLVKPTAESLIKNGKVIRGYLGVQVTDLAPNIADSLDESGTQGALVNQVDAGSPAQAAGLKPYDVVTGFDGHKVSNGSDLQTLAGAAAPGTTATVEVMRDGKPLPVRVTMGDYAKANSSTAADATDSASANTTPKLGISVSPAQDGNGVVVDSVTPGSPAQLAGVAQGDVIKQVNRQAVTTPDQLRAQLLHSAAGKDILLLVHKSNGDFILPVHPR
ncbi:MAG: Do family serine endopeptidase, partial [Terriglobales bacterium]